MAEKQNYSAGDLFVDIKSSSTGASRSINAVIKKLNLLGSSLNGIDTRNIDKIGEALNGVGTNGKGGKKATYSSRGGGLGFLTVAKWTGVIYSARRLARVVSSIAQSGADYTETLNLWETAMGNNLNIATQFVEKMNSAYGISEKTLMNAQAIFKNMLGSLGQITDQMAYSLSEGITQMAVDYASLYNVTFDKAFEKFQAMLAGQVRPIRSVSGYDITENTLYQLYQSLGGEKSVRNLSRTEKQLLSVLAVFNQMTASGAVGDLDKTMESYANQSRVMAESWDRVKTNAGIIFTYLIQESKILTYINAVLIFIGDTLKAVADYTGAIQSFGGANIFEDSENSATNLLDAINEIEGKLLGFDKFRALSGQGEEDVSLDQILLNAIAGYSTVLANASNEATELAEKWKVLSGLFNEDGTFNPERWEQIVDKIEAFGHALLAIVSSKVLFSLINGIKSLSMSSAFLSKTLFVGVIFAILQAIDAFKDGDITAGILATTIGVTLAGAFIYLHRKAILKAWQGLGQFLIKMIAVNTFSRGGLLKGILGLSAGFIGLSASIVGAFAIIKNWGDMNTWQKIIGIIGVATTAILGLAMAFGAFHSAWSLGLASAGIVAGIAMIVGSISGVKKNATAKVNYFANGGLPDKGTLFNAGEAGAEIVYNTPSGQSGVVNIQQIEQAMYGALVRYGQSQGSNGQPLVVYLDGEVVYKNTTAHAKKRGNVWSRA